MTNYLFFSGKGGVGKTTMAAVTAVYHAGKGKRTLLVSTDPAGNLGDVFERNVGIEPTRIFNNLDVVQMDAQAITDAYKQRMLEPLAAILDDTMFETVKEQFNGGCTVEIATFDRFTDFLDDETYDLVVFDTAPTGHTLRLMTLPQEWSGYIKKSSEGSGQTCIGPVSQIEGARQKYMHAVEMMQDAKRSVVYLVSRPEKTSVYETLRAKSDLEKAGIHHFKLIINGVYPDQDSNESGIFSKLSGMQQLYIKKLSEEFPDHLHLVPLQAGEIKGLDNIIAFGEIIYENAQKTIHQPFKESKSFVGFSDPKDLLKIIEKKTDERIVVLTGKGGVGKTVISCALASYLSQKGKTLLVTTDPAAHIGQVLEKNVSYDISQIKEGLFAVNIDQKEAVIEYKKIILDDAKANGYSDELLASLEEELESPCTEEIAIFDKFAALLTTGKWDYIVLDTAPTGHTLRLLELPFEYQKQIDMKLKGQTKEDASVNKNSKIQEVIRKLQNPDDTSFLLVSYPEFTPIYESYRALLDLERVGINIQGIMLNQVLKQSDCLGGFSLERWKMQQHYLSIAVGLYHKPLFMVPLQSDEIIGLKAVDHLQQDVFETLTAK